MHAICVNARLREALRERNVLVFPERAMKDRGKIINLMVAASLLVWMRFRFGISIVWIQGYSEIALLPLARLLGCKAVATRHLTRGSEARNLGSRIANKVYEHLAFTAHRIFCVSEAVACDMRCLVDERRIAVIPNWVPSLPTSLTPRNGNGLRLLFVGRLQPHKGAAMILDAMREIETIDNSDRVSLTIVGEGACRQELESLAQGLDVRFAGFQKDPSLFYREADVFINPSLGPEGLPLVSLEAMSYGLPCIFSDLKVHREITCNGEAAMLFRSEDAADLCDRIRQFLGSEKTRRQYGELARAAILAKHRPESARGAYLHQLETLFRAV